MKKGVAAKSRANGEPNLKRPNLMTLSKEVSMDEEVNSVIERGSTASVEAAFKNKFVLRKKYNGPSQSNASVTFLP